jgi:hypothetical protein
MSMCQTCTGKVLRYRPLGFQEIDGPRISRQSVHGRGEVVNPTHQPPIPPPTPGDIP